MNALTSEALENNPDNPTSQKGMSLDICNNEFVRDLIAMKTFMRENSGSTSQGNSKAGKPVCDYFSKSCTRLQTNSMARVATIESASAAYRNKYLAETLHTQAAYTQRHCGFLNGYLTRIAKADLHMLHDSYCFYEWHMPHDSKSFYQRHMHRECNSFFHVLNTTGDNSFSHVGSPKHDSGLLLKSRVR